jgi:hypothetical protein
MHLKEELLLDISVLGIAMKGTIYSLNAEIGDLFGGKRRKV